MGKRKNPFFAKHAKSSAMVISLIVHAIVAVVAIFLVVFSVNLKPEKQFRGKVLEKKAPPVLRKVKVPVKIEKKRNRAPKLRKNIVSKNVTHKTTTIKLPEITGVAGGLGGLDLPDGVGDIAFKLPEINFFGVKQKSEKVVFLVNASFKVTRTKGKNKQTPRSRMTFYTIKKRLDEMIQALPEYALFNTAIFWEYHTTPMSTNMVLATQENKDRMRDWIDPVNPLMLEETYGSGFLVAEMPPHVDENGFTEQDMLVHTLYKMSWPEDCLTNNLPPFCPQWMYDYKTSPEIRAMYKGEMIVNDFMGWSRALCFAMEQEPDTIFILTTGYDTFTSNGDSAASMNASFKAVAKHIYGSDRKKYPTVNVVILNKIDSATNIGDIIDNFGGAVMTYFGGKSEIIENIRNYMTKEERELLDSLPGAE